MALVHDLALGTPGMDGKVTPAPGWGKVVSWKFTGNIVAADDRFFFYGVAPEEEQALREHLRAFARDLPDGAKFVEIPERPAPG